MSALTDYAPPKQEIREIYEKTVQKLSKTLHILVRNVQPNSMGQLMLPPQFSTRLLFTKETGIKGSIVICPIRNPYFHPETQLNSFH